VAVIGYDASGRPVRDDQRPQQQGRVIGYDADGRAVRQSRSQPAYSEGDAFWSGAADTVTFGFGDELMGVFGGEDATMRSRQRQQALQTIHPGWYLGGQVAGGLAAGGGIGAAGRLGLRAVGAAGSAANLAQRVGFGGRVAAGAVVGGAGGAAYGAGSSYDGNRLNAAAQGVLPGAIGGGLGQAGGELIGAGARALGRFAGPEASATSMISGAQRRFGQVGQQLETDLANAPQGALVMDVIPGGPQIAQGASGRASRELPETDRILRARNQTMAQDTVDDLWSNLNGTPRGSASATVRQLSATREQQARPLYRRAEQQRINESAADRRLGEIVRRNPFLFRESAQDFQEILASEGIDAADRGSVRYWHALQRGADRAFERLRNTQGGLSGEQRRIYGRALSTYRAQLVRLTGGTRGDFAQAQAIWSGATRQAAAVRRGYEAATPSANDLELGDLADEMRRMTPGEREHMRMGALTRLADMIENNQSTSGRSNPVRAVLRSEGQRRVLQTLFGGEARLADVIRRIEQRQELFDNTVQAGIGLNSHTANRLAARESQLAQTNPFRGGSLWSRATGQAADQWDEEVSNQLLRELRLPASDALSQIQSAGGVRQWARGRGLLSAAQRQALDAERYRRRALGEALSNNLYFGAGGSMVAGGGE
jgi:hypothetical protein